MLFEFRCIAAGLGAVSSSSPVRRIAAKLASTGAPSGALAARSTLVDNAKAIGIVLVVIGHAPAIPVLANNFIFAFHMPLFFLLSGLLVNARRLEASLTARSATLARTLLLPYVFFFAASFVYWLLVKRHGLRSAEFESLPWWDPLIGLVSGTGDTLYVNPVLWFFPCLFLTALMHHTVRKRLTARWTVFAAVLVSFAFVVERNADMPRWYWSLDCAVVMLPFYAVGSWLAEWRLELAVRDAGGRVAFGGILAAVVCFGVTVGNGHVDVNQMTYGSYPALFLPLAILGITSILALAALLPAFSVARWLSMNTLVIFPLHMLMFSLFTGIAIRFLHVDPAFKDSSTWPLGVLYTLLALLLSYPASRLLAFGAPWLFARHRQSAIAPMPMPDRHGLQSLP